MAVILGIVPARGGSKGLPGKNLRPLDGVPLVVYTIRAAQQCARLSDFLVSTDDPAVAETARGVHAPVPFIRPAELATDAIALWPAIRHAVTYWESAHEIIIDAAVVLQPTSPLRTAEDIDGCIRQLYESDADICATVTVSHDNPYFNLVEPCPDTMRFVRPCSPVTRVRGRRQDAPRVYALNGAVYAVRRSVLDIIENQFLERFAIYEMPRERSIDIDDATDLALAEWLLTRRRPRS